MKQLILVLAAATLLLMTAPVVTATHQACPHHDCPLWARSSNYATPTSTSTSAYWYDDRHQPTTHRRPATHRPQQITYIEYVDVHHPPRTWYVRYNDNYHQTRTQTHPRRHQPKTSFSTGWTSPGVYQGAHFNVYY